MLKSFLWNRYLAVHVSCNCTTLSAEMKLHEISDIMKTKMRGLGPDYVSVVGPT